MSKDGDPHSVRHLRPRDVPMGTIPVVTVDQDDGEEMSPENEAAFMQHVYSMLEHLREPFEAVEKRPQPKWKKAWEDQDYQNCDECGGYHPLGYRTIHLDYIGHAEVTKRLLEVDPLWDWEPLAYDADGLPKFDRFGGLWIKLTVCGVTRKGYGDAAGKNPGTTAVKEIIGDAIRNAAMRFGVALDLWSKLDRQQAKHPEAKDYESDRQTSGQQRNRRQGPPGGDTGRSGEARPQPSKEVSEAMESVKSICNEHGYSLDYADQRFKRDYKCAPAAATVEQLYEFGQKLIEEATADPRPDDSGGDEGGEAGATAAGDRDAGDGQPADEAQSGPLF